MSTTLASKYLTSLIGVGMFIAVPAHAELRHEMTWSGLPSIVGRNVRIVTPDGSMIQGTVTSVESDVLVLAARKGKKSVSVERPALKTIDVADFRIRGRVIGVATGAAIGVVAAAVAQYSASDAGIYGSKERAPGRAAGFAAVAVALPVAGYFIGRKADSRWTTIAIVPEGK
jgi:hypothetical protein